MRQSIALTGATGFVGGALLKRLASMDWRIRALVRPTSSHKRSNQGDIEWVAGDLDDNESLSRLVAGVDFVVHCAGAVRGFDQVDFDRVNVDGVARLVSAARTQYSQPRFILISSLAAREPQLSAYAASKRRGEEILVSTAGPMPWVVFRPPAIYGPGDRELMPLLRCMCGGVAPLVGSADSRISLLYVEDMAEALACFIENGLRWNCSYEVHDGRIGGYSWSDIIDTVSCTNGRRIYRIKVPSPFVRLGATLNLAAARLAGRKPMLTPGKVRELTHPDWVADNSALTRDTGWVPRVTLEEGLRRTLKRDHAAA